MPTDTNRDMVAGHSLGEYAALMSAGILDMDGALRAAAARGTEMGSVEIDDKGLMASVTAPYERIAEIIEEVDGYVIAANKNSPKMTVIAGETEPVKAAMSRFEAEGFPNRCIGNWSRFPLKNRGSCKRTTSKIPRRTSNQLAEDSYHQ